ncbi:MAG: creatininase family protein [Acutalibacteraceae bacterium]
MQWEKLTVDDFAQAMEQTKGVCLVPLGCLEKHGSHMPLGTDVMVAREVSIRAAEREAAMVFPYIPFGIVAEVKHKQGTTALSSQLQYRMLEELCDELARNGYNKIVFVNGHGGSTRFLQYFLASRLEKPHPYVTYLWEIGLNADQHNAFIGMNGPVLESGHADIFETSAILSFAPELIHMDRIQPEESRSLGRLDFLGERRVSTGIAWYGSYPHQFAGDPSAATAEKGDFLMKCYVDNLADSIRVIKEEDKSAALQREFYQASEAPSC